MKHGQLVRMKNEMMSERELVYKVPALAAFNSRSEMNGQRLLIIIYFINTVIILLMKFMKSHHSIKCD